MSHVLCRIFFIKQVQSEELFDEQEDSELLEDDDGRLDLVAESHHALFGSDMLKSSQVEHISKILIEM